MFMFNPVEDFGFCGSPWKLIVSLILHLKIFFLLKITVRLLANHKIRKYGIILENESAYPLSRLSQSVKIINLKFNQQIFNKYSLIAYLYFRSHDEYRRVSEYVIFIKSVY